MYQITPVHAFQDNYIWMLQHPRYPGLAIAVDPGQSEPVVTWLQQQQLKLAAILITHHHPDHVGGVSQLADNIPVYGPANSPFDGITEPLQDGDIIELLGQTLHIKAVPAHTLDHIAYFCEAAESNTQPQLFCGDTLFVAGCGRLFEGSALQMQQAMAYFRTLPDSTQVCCTHEYTLANLSFASTVEPDNENISQAIERCQALRNAHQPTLPGSIGEEKRINPYMRYDDPAVVAAAQHRSSSAPHNDAEVLAVIRQWKDTF
ncbi:MAG: hydroxyacylglutathione hydrolase [Motiliproteus sp.]